MSLAQTFGIQADIVAGVNPDEDYDFGDAGTYDDDSSDDGVTAGTGYVGDFMSSSMMGNPDESSAKTQETEMGDSDNESDSDAKPKRAKFGSKTKAKSRSELEEAKAFSDEDDTEDKKVGRLKKSKKAKKAKKEKVAKEKTKKVEKADKSEKNKEESTDKTKEVKKSAGEGKTESVKEQKEKEVNHKETKTKKEHKSKRTHAVVSRKAMIDKPKKVAKHKDIPAVKPEAKININYSSMVRKDLKNSKSDATKAAEQEKKKENVAVPEPITSETVKQYSFKKIRKTLRKYKVKRDHKLAIVDRCEKYNIYQTPAYIWTEGNDFHMLLIENEPRHIVLSRMKLGRITYLKKQPVNTQTDYEAFNVKSILTDLFRPYLPDYNQSSDSSDLNYYKNLYGIGQGIFFTNTSAKQLVDIFGFDLDVEDKVTSSKRVNIFFKDVYKANIMVRDNVLDANGYADRISTILEDMASSSISYNEFKDTLNLMIKNKFITKEFGMHFMEIRDKKHS